MAYNHSNFDYNFTLIKASVVYLLIIYKQVINLKEKYQIK
jgi:hypothetical protein